MAHPMVQVKPSRRQRDMSPVHPNAAAIDIGARMHVAAVGPDRDPEPVRTFNTFTDDLHRLADWFEQCGVKTVVMEFHQGLLDSDLRDPGTARVRGVAGQCPGRQTRSWPQDRRQ